MGERTAVDRGGKVMEMLVKRMEVLVKIAVMMLTPRRCSGASGSKGERAPSFFFFLDLPLDGRRVSPLVLGLHGVGGARAPSRLDLSLCFCVLFFCPGTVSFISGDPYLRLD